MNLPTLEEFDIMCSKHDYYYGYSDDHNVWKKGFAKAQELENIVRTGGDAYRSIYHQRRKEC